MTTNVYIVHEISYGYDLCVFDKDIGKYKTCVFVTEQWLKRLFQEDFYMEVSIIFVWIGISWSSLRTCTGGGH